MAELGKGISEEELAAILAQGGQGHGGQGGQGPAAEEAGSAQIIDAEGNTVTVSAAQMASVGIDTNSLNDITEEQIAQLLALASGHDLHPAQHSQAHHQPPPQHSQHPPQQQGGQPGAEGEGSGDLTMVIGEDGSLKLLEPSGTEFLLSAADLAASGINVAALDEEAVQTIVQLAMAAKEKALQSPGLSAPAPAAPAAKRPRMEPDFHPAPHPPHPQSNGQEAGEQSRSVRGGQRSPGSALSMIGKEVEVRKGGKLLSATIRYCRQGAGLKVQFDDGHFEWVQEEQVSLRGSKTPVKAASPTKAQNGAATPSSLGRRVPPAVPGIRVTPQNQALAGASGAKCGDPNFVCPICQAKVYQKEPAYIVIRLPACETCADSKILVLDQDEPLPPPAQPQAPAAPPAAAAAAAASPAPPADATSRQEAPEATPPTSKPEPLSAPPLPAAEKPREASPMPDTEAETTSAASTAAPASQASSLEAQAEASTAEAASEETELPAPMLEEPPESRDEREEAASSGAGLLAPVQAEKAGEPAEEEEDEGEEALESTGTPETEPSTEACPPPDLATPPPPNGHAHQP